MIILYGIPNCDTTKKAIAWLTKNNLPYKFHDYKTEGISQTKLEDWCNRAGLETVFNKRSTTWRELPEAEQIKANNPSGAIALMIQHNSIIKRPIIENGKQILVGYNEKDYQNLLA